ncbi:MAG: hypothetical protein R3E58_08530 [Phycisphaerae bacterium]
MNKRMIGHDKNNRAINHFGMHPNSNWGGDDVATAKAELLMLKKPDRNDRSIIHERPLATTAAAFSLGLLLGNYLTIGKFASRRQHLCIRTAVSESPQRIHLSQSQETAQHIKTNHRLPRLQGEMRMKGVTTWATRSTAP